MKSIPTELLTIIHDYHSDDFSLQASPLTRIVQQQEEKRQCRDPKELFCVLDREFPTLLTRNIRIDFEQQYLKLIAQEILGFSPKKNRECE